MEIQSLIKKKKKNQTWELIEKPANKKVVDCKWVYKIKEGIPSV